MKKLSIQDSCARLNAKNDLSHFPRSHCVYYLFDGDDVVYVGRTSNLFARIGQHIASEKMFTSFSATHCDSYEQTLSLEFLEIIRNNPKYNSTCGSAESAGFLNSKDAKEFYSLNKSQLKHLAKIGALQSVTYNGVIYFSKIEKDTSDSV